MMQFIYKNIKILTLVALLVVSATAFAKSPTVSAVNESSDPLVAYCQQKITSKTADDACTRTGNETDGSLSRVRNIAAYKCTDNPLGSDEKDKCILTEAKKLIDKVAATTPQSQQEFIKAVEKVLNDAGGSPTNGPGDAGALPGDSGSGDSAANCKATDGTCADCTNTSLSGCDVGCDGGTCKDPAANPNANCSKQNCDIIQKYLNPAINLLSVSFGLIAVISIILGGIQYAASEGDPQRVAKAKGRIINTIIAIIAYFFLYSFLQFLIPGGLFNRG